jgi:hypothetical protein
MDKKIKRKWIRALRSGKYEQATSMLCDKSGAMCCLGVLAVIQGASIGSIQNGMTSDLAIGLNAGLRKRDREKLSYMNDDGNSFKDIAGYISEHY